MNADGEWRPRADPRAPDPALLPAERTRGSAVLVCGTTSDAGKSVLVTGLCRALSRRGVSVAPFKAQNMSNNSWVTVDGAEIGRAQVAQAMAAGVEPEAAMNPVLLKPGGNNTSQLVLRGRAVAEVGAKDYRRCRQEAAAVTQQALADLRSRFDLVICEGAGSPAEINLRHGDIANMGLAQDADLPVLVVGDIDRGGVFAAMYGTVALLSAADQARIAGFVVNKFRGDADLLRPGLQTLSRLTGRPTLGVLPWLENLRLDVEDSLGLPGLANPGRGGGNAGSTQRPDFRVAVLRVPLISNFTDLDALAIEPGVEVSYVEDAGSVAEADLVVLPGTRATVSALTWLRQRGLDAALTRRAGSGGAILGICGGFQALATEITDDVESGAGTVPGLGLLPTRVAFGREKVLGRPSGIAWGHPVRGYEIHHGVITVEGGEPFLDGCRTGSVLGTTWHGVLENDGFRQALLGWVAGLSGKHYAAEVGVSFAAARQVQFDLLADAVEQHLDLDAVQRLAASGAPTGLPFLPPGAP